MVSSFLSSGCAEYCSRSLERSRQSFFVVFVSVLNLSFLSLVRIEIGDVFSVTQW